MAKKVRDAMVRDPKRWRRIASDRAFTSTFAMTGDSLKRLPRGYDSDDPLADDLKRKEFIVGSRLADREITSRALLEFVIDRYRVAMPLMQFLADSVGS